MGGLTTSVVRESNKLRRYGSTSLRVSWATGVKRYWRIYMTAINATGDLFCFQELEFRLSAGGADVSLTTSPCSASSILSGSFPVAEAIDNNTTDPSAVWAAANASVPAWWWVDLVSHQEIVEVAIMPQNSVDGPKRSPLDFLIQWSSDSTAWNTVKTVTGSTGWTAGVYRTFSIP